MQHLSANHEQELCRVHTITYTRMTILRKIVRCNFVTFARKIDVTNAINKCIRDKMALYVHYSTTHAPQLGALRIVLWSQISVFP